MAFLWMLCVVGGCTEEEPQQKAKLPEPAQPPPNEQDWPELKLKWNDQTGRYEMVDPDEKPPDPPGPK